jgi:hypothetical protein
MPMTIVRASGEEEAEDGARKRPGWGAGGPGVRAQKGVIERLYTAPPEGGVVVCLDEMVPQSAKSCPGRRVVKPAGPEAQRVT